MEFFVFLIVLALLAISVGNFGRKRRKALRSSKKFEVQRLKFAPTVDRKPFNPRTATRSARRESISGSAYVIDGDSIVIKKTQIRLFGVDAPELNHPYGKIAKWALVKLCKGNRIKAEIVETDHFGRCVARCHLQDGRDLSAEMVKLGLAIDWPKYSGGKYGSLETPDLRKKLWLADARQKGRMHVWAKFEAREEYRTSKT